MAVELMTSRTIHASHWTFVAHMNLGRTHISNYESVDFPGFIVSKAWDRKERKTTRTFFVTGDWREFATLHEAGKAWNDLNVRGLQPPEREGSAAA